jgi:two-component system, LytTR family, sensor histidine kinase AlgZ
VSSPADTYPVERSSAAWTVAYWAYQVMFWGSYVAIGLAMMLPRTGAQPVVIGGYVLFFFYSVGLSHVVRIVICRRDWLALSGGAAVLRIGGTAVALGTALAALVLTVQSIWTRANAFAASPTLLVGMWLSTTSFAVIWTALYVGAASLLRARRARHHAVQLELAMREARLKALEAQIGPHFLFNCLNTLRGLIVENPTVAQDIVTRLANILRYNLSRDGQTTEALSQQIEFTTDYLALESVRFEERLRTKFDLDPTTLSAEVPAMLLQTLVENAIKHGISHLPNGGEISVSSKRDRNGLSITVENTGKLVSSPSHSTRVGLANLRERLRVLHGPDAVLSLTETDHGTVLASVWMPSTLRSR